MFLIVMWKQCISFAIQDWNWFENGCSEDVYLHAKMLMWGEKWDLCIRNVQNKMLQSAASSLFMTISLNLLNHYTELTKLCWTVGCPCPVYPTLWPDISSPSSSSCRHFTTHFAQRAGKGKTRPVTHQYSWNSQTEFSSTFSSCRFSPLAGTLAPGHTFLCFHRLSQLTGCGWKWRKSRGCSVSPAGLLQPSCSALGNGPSAVLTPLINE